MADQEGWRGGRAPAPPFLRGSPCLRVLRVTSERPFPNFRRRNGRVRMIFALGRQMIDIGEGPQMECPECGERVPFDLKLTYASLRLGALGCAHRFRWLFECRACREAWIVKRSLVRELEQRGVPIPFLERDGLLVFILFLALFLLLLRL